MNKIRQIVVIDYEPKDAFYLDTPVEHGSLQDKARHDRLLILQGELMPPQDWDKDCIKEVHSFIIEDGEIVDVVETKDKVDG